MHRRVGIFCDLGPTVGAGHAVRSSALAAALLRRGVTPVLLCDEEHVPWVGRQAREQGIEVQQATDVESVIDGRFGMWSGLVIDSYRITGRQWLAVRDLGVPVLAVDDLADRELPVDLVVNQNVAAATYDYRAITSARVLTGPKFALIRESVARARPQTPRPRSAHNEALRVLAVLGGTDAAGASAELTERLVAGDAPAHVRVLTADARARERIEGLPLRPGWTVEALPPAPDIERHMLWADAAVSAAGSTVWELCCLGVPMALVTAAGNQQDNYSELVRRGLVIGLGSLADGPGALANVDRILDPALLVEIAARAWRTVDGRGAHRVADEFEALLPRP
jgi:spore coat polysaccharide biosynthesis predicted glycosyltransferase SpsG